MLLTSCFYAQTNAVPATNSIPTMNTEPVRLSDVVPCKSLQRAMAGKHQHIVAYGTSLTWAGSWTEKLRLALDCEKAKHNFTISNVGQNSQCSRWGLGRLDERVLKLNPDVVMIEFGVNDAFVGLKLSLDESRKNLEAMIGRILKHNPDCDIILMTTTALEGQHAAIRPNLEAYYQVCRDVAKERGLVLVDMYPTWKKLLQEDHATYLMYMPDHLHPGPKADVRLILPAILKALGLESFATGVPTDQERAQMPDKVAGIKRLMANPEVKLALSKDEVAFIVEMVGRVEQALAEQQFDQAWYLMSNSRFQILYDDFLAKAKRALARLPENIEQDGTVMETGGPRLLTAIPATGPVIVDGKLDEPDWRKVKWSAGFQGENGAPAMMETGVKALYDKDNLYLAFICADQSVGQLKGGPAWSWEDDELVVFLQPDETQPVYYQLGFNWAGTQFHQKVKAGQRIYDKQKGWKPACSAADKYWTAEVVYPWAMFGLKDKGAGQWRINCHRVMRDQLADKATWNLEPGPWHEPANGARQPFGKLVFP